MNDRPLTNLKELFPHLTDEEYQEAKFALERYLRFILRLHDSINADPKRRAKFEERLRDIRNKNNRNEPTPPVGGVGKHSTTSDLL